MIGSAGRFAVRRVSGDAGVVHAMEVPDDPGPQVWIIEAEAPAIVLGSSQAGSDIDPAGAERAGLAVVRRRSGGGAVLVDPATLVWLDVILPAADPLWDPDVGRSGWWLGDVWVDALAALGVRAVVHRESLAADPLTRTVCFVGRAPGEVLIGDRKVVGVSQRRTRGWARFQCAALLRWDGDALLTAMRDLDPTDVARVRSAGIGLEVPSAAVVDAFFAALRTR